METSLQAGSCCHAAPQTSAAITVFYNNRTPKEIPTKLREHQCHLSLPFCPPRIPPHLPSTPQSRLQAQLMTMKTEMDEAKAQGTQMGTENGALTGVLGHKGAAQG